MSQDNICLLDEITNKLERAHELNVIKNVYYSEGSSKIVCKLNSPLSVCFIIDALDKSKEQYYGVAVYGKITAYINYYSDKIVLHGRLSSSDSKFTKHFLHDMPDWPEDHENHKFGILNSDALLSFEVS